jgi:cold shock CspA family protein
MEARKFLTGTVISWFSNGYGFIKETITGQRYFIHIKDTLNRDLEVGMIVRFIIGEHDGRPVAKEVE